MWYPSSKTCSVYRNWQCNACGTVHDRDRNAAINIFRVGASTHEGKGRKPRFVGQSLLIAQFDSYWEGTRTTPNPLGLGVRQLQKRCSIENEYTDLPLSMRICSLSFSVGRICGV